MDQDLKKMIAEEVSAQVKPLRDVLEKMHAEAQANAKANGEATHAGAFIDPAQAMAAQLEADGQERAAFRAEQVQRRLKEIQARTARFTTLEGRK